ncbi:hypothetical protein [Trichloromonas sp.]|uniref:hypothetical protein n=1 Tax=Trichloromonas sp. TaxID=3069249 RepID=UPI003D818D68
MHHHHYDIIILGESLAARLAAVLLAKAGKKVLTFRQPNSPVTPWLFNSIHLGQVLDQLGGRNCLTTPRRLQVITKESRLELHGKQLLADELRREFPSSHQQVARILDSLVTVGARLETLLLDCGGLPLFDLAGRLRFRRKLLLSRISWRTLRKPLASLLDEIIDPAPRACLEALFSGLAMASTDRLTIAEGALLWSSACQAQGISRSALDDLLQRRYEQFHGGCEPLETIKEIGSDGRILLKSDKACSADVLLVGSPLAAKVLPESDQKLFGEQQPPCRWKTSPILLGIAPVLASRVILADPQPLRVTLTPTPTGTVCTTESRAAVGLAAPNDDELRSQLAGILPFASFNLFPAPTGEATAGDSRWPACSAFPGTAQRLRLRKNLLLGSGMDALPHLGSTGEIMTGFALARHLLRADKPRD